MSISLWTFRDISKKEQKKSRQFTNTLLGDRFLFCATKLGNLSTLYAQNSNFWPDHLQAPADHKTKGCARFEKVLDDFHLTAKKVGVQAPQKVKFE